MRPPSVAARHLPRAGEEAGARPRAAQRAFIGQAALQKIAKEGVKKTLVGLQVEGRRSPRQGMKVWKGDKEVGVVTSGCLAPSLDYPIAMAYVPPEMNAAGTELQIDLGSAKAAAKVVKMPFYSALK